MFSHVGQHFEQLGKSPNYSPWICNMAWVGKDDQNAEDAPGCFARYSFGHTVSYTRSSGVLPLVEVHWKANRRHQYCRASGVLLICHYHQCCMK